MIPLFVIWLFLLPFPLLALPLLVLFALAALAAPVRTWRGARSILSLLSAERRTCVEMSAPNRSVLVHVW